MSFFKRKAKSKEPERPAETKVNRGVAPPASPHSPSLGGARNQHAVQEAAGPSHVAINVISANMDSFARGRTAILKKQPSHMEAAHFGDLGHSSVNYMSQETRSRLSKTLEQILRDGVAVPYYVQFLETQGTDHLVCFWLEAERFRSSSWSRVRAHSLNSVKHSSLAEPVPAEPGGGEAPEAPVPHRDTLNVEGDVDGRPGTPGTPTGRLTPSSRTGTPHKQQSTSALRDLSENLIKSIESDAVTIFTKYISPDAARPIPITEQIRNDIVEEQHFTEFLRSHHFCKYQIEVLTSGAVFLADILFSESALFYFSEYMEKEEAVNVLQFWLAADNFQDQLAAKKGQYDGQEAQNDAMILYDKYFSLQATNPLGFGDSVRMEIESNICREGGPLPDCFTTPLRQAWTTMETVYMPGFLSSNLYYKYLSDLINSVRADEFVSSSAHTGQGGTADGDRGASGEGSQAQNFDEAITVDASSLDPEVLYHRPYAGVCLSDGRTDSLTDGRTVCLTDSLTDGRTVCLTDGQSAQEEMAWKIAKMIVNDVIHQSNHDSPGKSTKVPVHPLSVTPP
ncbi:hypothetical protein NHX12_009815 [Muraenolepis orangiensis]|uniref:RGS domain-containing protein n=1 Tax=Muraenolepis orangiensis TaxID=630683 RepID=A0A9Q0DK23_9TELE|nr:hypothetical protein NHX12_009815 [Muraenolepis orangiensis]